MLKLTASYSKKVPAESEYSSQSYHASLELELPDGLSIELLREKIHETFEQVRLSVENELNGNSPQSSSSNEQTQIEMASPKQIKYLFDLARQNCIEMEEILAHAKVKSPKELTRKQCSNLIDEISGKAA